MKNLNIILPVMLMLVTSSQQGIAQSYNAYGNDYDNQNYSYDLSDHLDLEAVASVFAKSRNITDFERRLNDYRNQVSNLDLNNDGYVDYLRLVKFYDRGAHVILLQAVLGRDYFQDVATIIVGTDSYNREFLQIIGDPYLYGDDYILEPQFYKRPTIVRWMLGNSNYQYVSSYNWGYYPSHYRLRYILPMPRYFNHLHVIVNVHHRYYYTNQWRYSPSYDRWGNYSRNDYWRQHRNMRFDQRNQNIKNKGYFQYNENRREADVRERSNRDVRSSESERRSASPVIPQRDTRTTPPKVVVPERGRRESTPSTDSRVTTPSRGTKVVVPQRESKVTTPSRDTKVVVPQRESKVTTPSRDTRVVPQRESKPAVQKKEVKASTSRSSREETTKNSKESKSETPSRSSDRNSNSSSSGRR